MTNLTEQWKRGELESGWYYIEIDAPFEQKIKDINYYSLGSFDIDVDSNYITEVLAPVPSWEQWQSLNELLDSMRDTNKVLAHKLNNIKVNGNYPDKISKLKSRIKGLLEENERLKKWVEEFNALNVAQENQKLKDLLKECNLLLIKQQANDEVEHKESAELVLRIEEVLK